MSGAKAHAITAEPYLIRYNDTMLKVLSCSPILYKRTNDIGAEVFSPMVQKSMLYGDCKPNILVK